MADYELHADYDRNGRLDASSAEYDRRLVVPGAIVVPNLDADGRALPANVVPGSRIMLDGRQPIAPATDDEQLTLRVLVRRASAAAGTRFFLRPVGFPHHRLRFNDAQGRMLPRDLARENDIVWVGNWGDDERTRELQEFLIEPVHSLGLKGRAFGVRYPESGISDLGRAGIEYSGWVPNYEVPEVFARARATVHIPRRPYVELLPGIPTIRPFEALACGIPLVCSPWEDAEGLFSQGKDFLVAKNGEEMRRHLRALINDRDLSDEITTHGMRTVLSRHTCRHRVEELLRICEEMGINVKSDEIDSRGDTCLAD